MGKFCLECGKKRASYNFPNQKTPLYCKEHAKEGMEDVKNKRCLECKKQPAYNFPNQKSGIYCKDHMKEGMEDVRNKRCLECRIQASYNFPNERIALYCKEHSKEGMEIVRGKKCLECRKQPAYNFPDQKIPLYCKEHAKEGMEDIKSKRCLECKKRPNYNFSGQENALYCKDHMKKGMEDVKNKKCLDCGKRSSYNFPGQTSQIYCKEHAKEGMENINAKKCISGFCKTIANKYYNNYCCYCFTNLFPVDPKTLSARKKNKEIAVKGFLYENGHSDFIHDKPMYLGDCATNRRTDLYKFFPNNYILCIEIDENQHKWYKNEEQRYHDLYPLVDGKEYKMVFIRYNPDGFIDKNGKRKTPQFNTRMKVLLNEIETTIEKMTNGEYDQDLLTIKYLYYDEKSD